LANAAGQSKEPARIPHEPSCDFEAKAIRECSTELKSTLTIDDGWVSVKVPACAILETIYTPAFNRQPGDHSGGTTLLFAKDKTSLGQSHDTIVIRGDVVHNGFPWPQSPLSDVDIQTVLACLVYPEKVTEK
jgi:hypothetical protein